MKNMLLVFRNSLRNSIDSTFEPKTEMGSSRVNITASNYTTGVINNFVGGNFFTGLLLLLNADDAMLGTMMMIGFIGNTLQILSPLIIERFEKRKKVLIFGKCAIHFLNIVVISSISILSINYRSKLIAVMVVVLTVSIFNAILSPGISVWHIKSIPESFRVKYFSFYNVTNGIILYVIILGASKLVDVFKEAGNEMLGLLLLRAFALLLAILDIYFLLKVKEYPNRRGETVVSIKQILIIPFKQKKYLITVLIACLWSFSANIPGPYYTAYMLKDLKVPYSYLNLINMLNIPMLIIFTPLWSRRISRTSWFRTLCFSMGIYLFNYIGLAFVTKETLYYLFPLTMIFAFILAPGINIVFSNAPYINIPEANQTNYLGFYAAMCNLAAFAGTSLGREFIKSTEGMNLNILGTIMQNKQYILLLTAAVMILSVLIIKLLQRKTDN